METKDISLYEETETPTTFLEHSASKNQLNSPMPLKNCARWAISIESHTKSDTLMWSNSGKEDGSRANIHATASDINDTVCANFEILYVNQS